MKYHILLLLIAFSAIAHAQLPIGKLVSDSAWSSDIKTILFGHNSLEVELPILTMGNSERLMLQFDLLQDQAPSLRYTIQHCDANWHVDDLPPYEFLSGFETSPIENFDFSFTTRLNYVHYSQAIPGRYDQFLYSGNYVLSIFPDDDPNNILLTRRFCVSEQSVKISASTSHPYDGIDINRRQQVNVELTPGPYGLQHPYLSVRLLQNLRFDNIHTLQFSGYNADHLTYNNRPPNIFDGGNSFRFFDCSNLHIPMYNVQRIEVLGGEIFAMLRPDEDRSRKRFSTEASLNGGMKVNIVDRDNPTLEADYVWVNFSLPMDSPLLGGSVHIVGALTNWQLDSLSRMEYNPQYHAYTARLLLKQGYYAYQLLYRDLRTGQASTRQLEGDHWETPNRYTVLVYQRQPADRADRLLGIGYTSAP